MADNAADQITLVEETLEEPIAPETEEQALALNADGLRYWLRQVHRRSFCKPPPLETPLERKDLVSTKSPYPPQKLLCFCLFSIDNRSDRATKLLKRRLLKRTSNCEGRSSSPGKLGCRQQKYVGEARQL